MTELLQSTTSSRTTAVETPFSVDELGAHERIVHAHDERTGLRAIIAIHSTLLGPALGGTRFYPYADAGGAGDSAPMTALGVFEAMRAAAGRTWGASTLDGWGAA